MPPKPVGACFLITDIFDYTSFLNGAELGLAQGITVEVMDPVRRRLRPPFRLADVCGRGPLQQLRVDTRLSPAGNQELETFRPQHKDFVLSRDV